MTFESFDNIEDAFAAMAAQEDAANRRTTPEQKAIGYGDYFIRDYETMFGFGESLTIYGYIMTRDEFIESERDAGSPEDELAWTLERMDSSYERGYRFGWCYSEVEPDGELGSTHVSTMTRKISKEEFEAAKERGWMEG